MNEIRSYVKHWQTKTSSGHNFNVSVYILCQTKIFLAPSFKRERYTCKQKQRYFFLFFEEGVMSFCDFGKYTNNRHRAIGEDKTDDH